MIGSCLLSRPFLFGQILINRKLWAFLFQRIRHFKIICWKTLWIFVHFQGAGSKDISKNPQRDPWIWRSSHVRDCQPYKHNRKLIRMISYIDWQLSTWNAAWQIRTEKIWQWKCLYSPRRDKNAEVEEEQYWNLDLLGPSNRHLKFQCFFSMMMKHPYSHKETIIMARLRKSNIET